MTATTCFSTRDREVESALSKSLPSNSIVRECCLAEGQFIMCFHKSSID